MELPSMNFQQDMLKIDWMNLALCPCKTVFVVDRQFFEKTSKSMQKYRDIVYFILFFSISFLLPC